MCTKSSGVVITAVAICLRLGATAAQPDGALVSICGRISHDSCVADDIARLENELAQKEREIADFSNTIDTLETKHSQALAGKDAVIRKHEATLRGCTMSESENVKRLELENDKLEDLIQAKNDRIRLLTVW